jgi:phospholipid-binding lipoprotein MlaA
MEAVSDLERSSVDIYAATRSLYRQYRASEIRNGRAGSEDLPEF